MYETILQGMAAARLLDERRADAARDRAAARAVPRAKHDARRTVGELLVRAGSRLAGTAGAGQRIPAHAA